MGHTNQQKEFLSIIKKYLSGKTTENELDFIKKYYEHFEKEENVLNTLSDKDREHIGDQMENAIIEKMGIGEIRPLRRWWRPLLTGAAAVALIALSFGIYWRSTGSRDQVATTPEQSVATPDILPGGNKATLQLADGSTIYLNDIKDGDVAAQNGIQITKAEDGLLTYSVTAATQLKQAALQYNTISTPKGGQYRVILPDGTSVWLNAASSLKYPIVFAGNVRQVELTGEGYFEVSDQRTGNGEKIPFLVNTATQIVEVLGTHFNISAYQDEPFTKTTLLEGAVKVARNGNSVEKSIVLKPGEQSTLTAQRKMTVSTVDTDNIVAWKSGLFQFQDSDIESVMRELSRWYDVEVEFEGKVPDIKLWGKVYRNVNASEALRILSYFDLKYRIIQKGNTKKIVIS